MAKIKTTCRICAEIIKSETVPDSCPRCGADLTDPQKEIVLKQTHCQYSSTNRPGSLGNLYLTNQRILWVNSSTAATYGGGIVGALIANHQKWGFSLPLTDIKSFADGKFGLFVKAFIITANDGSNIKLSAKPKDDWIDAITKAKEQLRNS
jgi:hypothetical protein